jgi:O-antigen/teichoic acid export membrane protein
MLSLFHHKTFKAFYSVFASLMYFLLDVGVMILITKISGLEGAGDYGTALTVALLGSFCALFGMDRYLAKQLSVHLTQNKEQEAMILFRKVLRTVLYLSFLLSFILFVALSLGSLLSPDLLSHPIWFAVLLIPPMTGSKIVVRALDILNKFILEATIYRILLNLVIFLFVLYLYAFAIPWPVSAMISGIALIWILFFILLCTIMPKGWIYKASSADLKVSFLGINVLFWFYQIVSLLIERIGLIFLEIFEVEELLVGVMANILTIVRISHFLFLILLTVVIQQFEQSKIRQDPGQAQTGLSFYSRVIIFSNAVLLLIFCFFGKAILQLFDAAAAPYHYVLLLIFAGIFLQWTVGYAWYYVLLCEEKKFTYAFFSIQAIFVILLDLFLIPAYSILGAALAFLIPMVFGTCVFYLYFRKKYHFKILGSFL